MDFAKLVQNYLNQRTEGDPSFIVSEEAIAFVDLMRADDMDRRASNVETQTSADARGEPATEEVTNESLSEPRSESGTDVEENQAVQSAEQSTEPAAPFSSVAPEDPAAAGSFSEQGPEPEPAELFSGSDQLSPVEPSSLDADSPGYPEPSPLFTQEGQQAATNEALREEGAEVTEYSGLHSSTTTIAPESMPDFDSLLRQFDSEYKPPDPPAGNMDLLPPEEELPESEPLMNTTEHAEVMVSEFLSTHLSYDRRGA